MSLVLIGFMGAGKTSAARSAAAELGGRHLDTDQAIEEELGTSIEAFFAGHGEQAFREREEEIISRLLEDDAAPVVSLGGGAVTSERLRGLLDRHKVVLLDVDEETAWRRCGGRRPLARDRARFDRFSAALAAKEADLAAAEEEWLELELLREEIESA